MEPQREWFEKDYYKILGVDRKASAKEITRAYRKLAKRLHPDANPGDGTVESRFKEVSAAYDVLNDAKKREAYDEVRRLGPMAGGFGGPRPGAGDAGGFQTGFNQMGQMGDLGGLLGNFFGKRQQAQARARKGADLESELHLDFAEAVGGTTATVSVVGDSMCRSCRGSGAKSPKKTKPCSKCSGTGTTDQDQGMFSFSRPCMECAGRGNFITNPCKACAGRGVEHRRRKIKARIPAGVNDGQRIKLKGRGAPGPAGGEPGDLFVRVQVKPHRLFGRKGRNLTLTVPVSYPEAVLGADVRVPTLDDSTVTIRIPPGTNSGTKLRIRGNKATRGADVIAEVEVVVPARLNAEQRAAVEALAQASDDNPRDRLRRK